MYTILGISIKQHCLCARASSSMFLFSYPSHDIYSEGDPTALFPEWRGDKSSIVFEINSSDLWPVMGASGSRIIIWC